MAKWETAATAELIFVSIFCLCVRFPPGGLVYFCKISVSSIVFLSGVLSSPSLCVSSATCPSGTTCVSWSCPWVFRVSTERVQPLFCDWSRAYWQIYLLDFFLSLTFQDTFFSDWLLCFWTGPDSEHPFCASALMDWLPVYRTCACEQ